MASNSELIALSAREAVALLRAGEVSPVEMVDAAADRIAAVDGDVNAMPIQCLDQAREQAKSLVTPDDPGPGWLAGLPVTVKDLNEVAGGAHHLRVAHIRRPCARPGRNIGLPFAAQRGGVCG